MTSRLDFARELARGTELVVRLADGEVSFREFLDQYDNFYHFNALDGHEADPAMADLLRELADACRIHRAVQEEVVDRLYLGDADQDAYVAAGRILPADAGERIEGIVKAHRARSVLESLRQIQ